jgi:exodeoxyribonuclease V alpha subunit
MDTLRGVIERITYHNEENGYTVAKLTPEQRVSHASSGWGRAQEIAIVGNMAGVNVGESVELSGRWTVHAEYGKQFSVEKMRTVLPATVAGIEKYLGSGLIKGVGPATAKRIVKQFGVETLNIIEEAPGRLIEVPNVGRKRTRMITEAWEEQRAIKEVMLFLQSYGVTTSLATKIYKTYGDDATAIVRDNPYRLARDIFGIGFLTADKIARAMGLAEDAPQRVAAGVAYTLNQATDNGHVFLPTGELMAEAAELLGVTPEQTTYGILDLWQDDQVKVAEGPGDTEYRQPQPSAATAEMPQLLAERGALYSATTQADAEDLLAEERAVYLTPMFYSEQGVANRLQRLVREGQSRLTQFSSGRVYWDSLFETLERSNGFALAPQQREAVETALTHRLTVLTGGPGTGKTTTVRTILQICQQFGRRALLAAPTGRAAKRLSETTGQEAKTVHRLLEFKPTEGMAFKRNEESPLEGDLLIVDEASMLDLVLTNHLLKAVPPGMHLLLVGDIDQLPSVGAGNVLKDVIGAIENQGTKQRAKIEDRRSVGVQKQR